MVICASIHIFFYQLILVIIIVATSWAGQPIVPFFYCELELLLAMPRWPYWMRNSSISEVHFRAFCSGMYPKQSIRNWPWGIPIRYFDHLNGLSSFERILFQGSLRLLHPCELKLRVPSTLLFYSPHILIIITCTTTAAVPICWNHGPSIITREQGPEVVKPC